jgi:hypothetical protein
VGALYIPLSGKSDAVALSTPARVCSSSSSGSCAHADVLITEQAERIDAHGAENERRCRKGAAA